MKASLSLVVLVLVVLGGALAGCGEEPIPDNVSYVKDIKPLMEARCIRCHGAGGTLNKDPNIDPGFLTDAVGKDTPADGDFTGLGTSPAGRGLMSYAGPGGIVVLKLWLDPGPKTPHIRMPPPPAPPLTSREHEMLLTWAANPLP